MPDITWHTLDMHSPTFTCCILLVKKLSNHLSFVPCTPLSASASNTQLCGTLSKEVLKSKLLQYASTGNTLECLRCLLSSFDHTSSNYNELIQKAVEEATGNTSLHLAAMKSPKNIATYTLLLEFGGNNKIKNKLGYTPEDYILGKVKV